MFTPFFKDFIYLFIYLALEWGVGAERKGERIPAGSPLSVEPKLRLHLTTWDQDLSGK